MTVFIATGDTGADACLQVAQIQPTTTLPSAIAGLSVQAPDLQPVRGLGRRDHAVTCARMAPTCRSRRGPTRWSARAAAAASRSDEARPPWQQGPGVTTAAAEPSATAGRSPTSSAPRTRSTAVTPSADTPPAQASPQCASGNGGTSAAAPFWAASRCCSSSSTPPNTAPASSRPASPVRSSTTWRRRTSRCRRFIRSATAPTASTGRRRDGTTRPGWAARCVQPRPGLRSLPAQPQLADLPVLVSPAV